MISSSLKILLSSSFLDDRLTIVLFLSLVMTVSQSRVKNTVCCRQKYSLALALLPNKSVTLSSTNNFYQYHSACVKKNAFMPVTLNIAKIWFLISLKKKRNLKTILSFHKNDFGYISTGLRTFTETANLINMALFVFCAWNWGWENDSLIKIKFIYLKFFKLANAKALGYLEQITNGNKLKMPKLWPTF